MAALRCIGWAWCISVIIVQELFGVGYKKSESVVVISWMNQVVESIYRSSCADCRHDSRVQIRRVTRFGLDGVCMPNNPFGNFVQIS